MFDSLAVKRHDRDLTARETDTAREDDGRGDRVSGLILHVSCRKAREECEKKLKEKT